MDIGLAKVNGDWVAESFVASDSLAMVEYPVCEGLKRGASVLAVELDAEVLVLPAGVVARGQQNAADALVRVGLVQLADDGRGCRRRDEPVEADHQLCHAVSGRHIDNRLDGHVVVVAAVPRYD